MNGDTLSAIADIVSAVATVAASDIAVWGIWQWRSQERWKRRADCVFESMVSLRNLEKKLLDMRTEVVFRGEVDEARARLEGTPHNTERGVVYMILVIRMERLQEIFDFGQFYSCRDRMQILCGQEAGEIFRFMNSRISALQTLARKRIELVHLAAGENDPELNAKVDRNRSILFVRKDMHDDFGAEIAARIQSFFEAYQRDI